MKDLKPVVSEGAVELEASALRHAIRRLPAEYRLEHIVYQVARLKVELESMQAQFAALRAATASMDVLLPMDQVMRGDGLPSEVTIEADELLNAEAGFYPPESDLVGRPYRWTGPTKDFGFDLLLNRSAPMAVTVELFGAMNDAQLNGLQGFCGNVRLVLERRSLEGQNIFSCILPEDEPGRMTNLRFWVPEVVCPATSLGSSDVRLLGVQFGSLKVRPVDTGSQGKQLKSKQKRSGNARQQTSAAAHLVRTPAPDSASSANGGHTHHEPTSEAAE